MNGQDEQLHPPSAPGAGMNFLCGAAFAIWWMMLASVAMMNSIGVSVESDPMHGDRVHFTVMRPDPTTADALAAEEPYYSALDGRVRAFDLMLKPERYCEILWERGCVEQRVRLNIYPHEMPGYEAVIEWVKGTYLTAYESRLSPALFARFMAEYPRRMEAAIPSADDLADQFEQFLRDQRPET